MALLKRRPKRPDPAAQLARIEAFWAWWAGAGPRVAQALQDGTPEAVQADLGRRVEAIHSALGWELGAGDDEHRYVLTVTAAGDPTLRGVARRWLRSAPPADGTWQYTDVRVPLADLTQASLVVDGHDLDLAQAVVAARVGPARVDVTVHHPAFAALAEQSRQFAVFLMLDAAVGEAAVETWIGSVAPAEVAPLDAFPLAHLRSVVTDVEREYREPDGSYGWALAEGTTDRGEAMVLALQLPLRPMTAPHFDTHVAVVLPYPATATQGLPAQDVTEDLSAFGDRVDDRLGGSGRVVARETGRGRQVLHAYVDGATPAAEQLRAVLPGWPHGKATLDSGWDPSWHAVEHLRLG